MKPTNRTRKGEYLVNALQDGFLRYFFIQFQAGRPTRRTTLQAGPLEFINEGPFYTYSGTGGRFLAALRMTGRSLPLRAEIPQPGLVGSPLRPIHPEVTENPALAAHVCPRPFPPS